MNPHFTGGAIAADGTMVAARAPTGIEIYDLPSGKKRTTILNTERNISALALSSRTQLLAAATEEKAILVWSLTDGHLVNRLEGLGAPIRTLQFNPDGKVLAGCAGDDTLLLWDSGSGKELRRLVESGAEITSVALSSDGALAALGHPDGTVRIWRTGTGRLLHLLEGHPGPVRGLAFSSDNRSLAAGSWLTLRLWEIASGKERLRLFDLPGEVTAAAITPGVHDAVLVGMSSSQSLRLPLEPPDMQVKAWSGAELNDLWKDLESTDAARAYMALTELAAKPDVAIPLMKERLQPLAPLAEVQADAVKRSHFQEVESDKFEGAARKRSGNWNYWPIAAEPALRNVLNRNPDSELRFRLFAILDKLQTPERQRLRLRGLRCCELLERIASSEAKKVLRGIAGGASGAWLTMAAQSSLDRLEK